MTTRKSIGHQENVKNLISEIQSTQIGKQNVFIHHQFIYFQKVYINLNLSTWRN